MTVTSTKIPIVASTAETAHSMQINDLSRPLGLGTSSPRFSWKWSPTLLRVQNAYRLQVLRGDDVIWDSGRVDSPSQSGVPYAGPALASRTRYTWRVRGWAETDEPTPWSEAEPFETGLLGASEWIAQWISTRDPDSEEAIYLHGTVTLSGTPTSGRVYASALGWYRLIVNGVDLTGATLVPRWTPLDQYVEYQTYDVTDVLRGGENSIDIVVADGRYRGVLGFDSHRAVFGNTLAAIAQLHVTFDDGTAAVAGTDATWQVSSGPIVTSDPKTGERVDLRRPDPLDAYSRRTVLRRPVDAGAVASRHLVAEEVPRVGEVARLHPERIWRAPSGEQIVDFGQNFAGVIQLNLTGPSGTLVRISYSELVTADGELNRSYLVGESTAEQWFQKDEVTLSGEDLVWAPWFTIHGFQYAAVSGLSRDLRLDDVEGIVLSSRLPAQATFTSSDARLNRLFENARWSLVSNFTDTPTDCPTRERSGWTADIQVFAPTANILVDANAYLRRYLRNLSAEQQPDGRIPSVIPAEFSETSELPWFTRASMSSVGWGDTAVMLPWAMYEHSGDVSILNVQYDTAKRWVSFLEDSAHARSLARKLRKGVGHLEKYIVDTGFHFGEWLRPGESGKSTAIKNMLKAPAVIATAYFAHSTQLLSQMAALTGRLDDAQRYSKLAGQVRQAWRAAFVRPDGRIGDDKQDDYVRALVFNLVLPERRAATLRRLVELIDAAGSHLGTGFLSTGYLLPVLANEGRADVALRLLLQTSAPSWLYQVDHGATTIWETWSGGPEIAKMDGSRNHYAFGSVAKWLIEGIAGLSAATPGYRSILINPVIGGGITSAAAEIDTPLGRAASSWTVADGSIAIDVTIPPGATGTIRMPGPGDTTLQPGDHHLTWALPRG